MNSRLIQVGFALPGLALRWLLLVGLLATCPWASAEEFDVVIRQGRIVDGTGAPWFTADMGIRDGRIVRIGRLSEAKSPREIDAAGLIVAPGFIDMMGQTATPMFDDPRAAMNLLTQGITTINAGEGVSAAPLSAEDATAAGWRTMAEYFQLLEMRGLPLNVVQTVGHTQVRRIVLGEVDRRPSPAELEQMKELVREGMRAGAIGLSTALIYPPAVYASTEEIAALASEAGALGGRYYTHMRNEGDQLLEAIDEALQIGRSAKTPVHIFHLKAAGRQNWGKIEQAIARIQAARRQGQEVTADVYPYINNGLGIEAFIHPRHFARGRAALLAMLDDPKLRAEIRREMEQEGSWENWYRHTGMDWNKVIVGRIGDPRLSKFAGSSLAEIAKAVEQDPWDTFFDLVRSGAFALPQSMSDANKIKLMRQEFVSFCTDVGPAGGSRIAAHPRAYGAFPRLLARYVRELGVISLEQAVSQASAVAANEVMQLDRGRLAEGLAADLIVFSAEQISDRATFAHPHRLSEGMKYVLVNGQVVLEQGKYSGARPGRVLRGPGYRRELAPSRVSSGVKDPRLASFDRLLARFMERHRVSGAALAVTNQGKVVHARGYGYADLSTQQPVRPNSLFRIASISKPITAVAILQLVEQGRLSLDDRVFEIIKLEPRLGPGDEIDERLRRITIRHLLEHRAGWDRGVSYDAMFQSVRFAKALGIPTPALQSDVIRFMLGQPLDFDPGQRYAYSNLGYCLLGRVIESKTGQTYEQYVKENVLAPLGIREMRLGHTRLEERAAGEVRYYDPGRGPCVFADNLNQTVSLPYGAWCLEAMDSHGGWIASAIDLARFACAFDDPANCPILKAESIQSMYQRPPGLAGRDQDGKEKEVFYSLGWLNRDVGAERFNRWHTGSLSGTASLMVRRHDGRNWIVLFNSRVSPQAGHLGQAIDPLLHQAADEVREWPGNNTSSLDDR